jgi:hypothetical protein
MRIKEQYAHIRRDTRDYVDAINIRKEVALTLEGIKEAKHHLY